MYKCHEFKNDGWHITHTNIDGEKHTTVIDDGFCIECGSRLYKNGNSKSRIDMMADAIIETKNAMDKNVR